MVPVSDALGLLSAALNPGATRMVLMTPISYPYVGLVRLHWHVSYGEVRTQKIAPMDTGDRSACRVQKGLLRDTH
jgi:hypothetical protein